jgi:glycosyltransferase involved in cell wall biosynthesis
MSPRVSVVMPSFNHADFVGEAVQSVLDQSFQDFEIVITDDASTDQSVEVIRAFRDSRIRLELSKVNRGGVNALNSAILRSTGEFVCYLASDDFFLPGKLSRQVAYLDSNPDIVAVLGLPKIVEHGGSPLPSDPVFAIPFPEREQSRARWLRRFFFHSNSLAHQTAMVRRSGLNTVGLFDPRLWQLPDFDLWVRLCVNFEIRVLPETFSALRWLAGAQNISAPRRDSLLRDAFEFFQILKHYRRLNPAFAREVFHEDLEAGNVDTNQPYLLWLAEIATRGNRPGHALFALDTMYEGLAGTEGSNRLVHLAGALDPFRIFAEQDLIERSAAAAAGYRSISPSSAPLNIGRNQLCPCGSGKRYKHCHGRAL